jgi:hypothetical protein
MPYRVLNSNGEEVEVPVKVSRAEDHKDVYAHGASGGPLANYHYRIDFYQDIVPPVEFVEVEGALQGDSFKDGIERKIMVSVFLSLPFAKELRNWLDKNIQGLEQVYGEIKLPGNLSVEKTVESKRKEA